MLSWQINQQAGDLNKLARFEATKIGDELQDIGEFRPAIL